MHSILPIDTVLYAKQLFTSLVQVSVELRPAKKLVPVHIEGRPPSYFIAAGLVFTPVVEPFLASEYGQDYEYETPVDVLQKLLNDMAEHDDQELVVLCQVGLALLLYIMMLYIVILYIMILYRILRTADQELVVLCQAGLAGYCTVLLFCVKLHCVTVLHGAVLYCCCVCCFVRALASLASVGPFSASGTSAR